MKPIHVLYLFQVFLLCIIFCLVGCTVKENRESVHLHSGRNHSPVVIHQIYKSDSGTILYESTIEVKQNENQRKK